MNIAYTNGLQFFQDNQSLTGQIKWFSY